MSAHLKLRGKKYYIADGSVFRSLGTTKKGLAEYLLKEYIKNERGQKPTPKVGEYFEKWIQTKIEPLFRRSKIRDYKQHFTAYILPRFRNTRLLAIGTES
jgi:hypothetical protein